MPLSQPKEVSKMLTFCLWPQILNSVEVIVITYKTSPWLEPWPWVWRSQCLCCSPLSPSDKWWEDLCSRRSLTSLCLVHKPREMSLTWSNSLAPSGVPFGSALYPAKQSPQIHILKLRRVAFGVEGVKKVYFCSSCQLRRAQASVTLCSADWQLCLKFTQNHRAKECSFLPSHWQLSFPWALWIPVAGQMSEFI